MSIPQASKSCSVCGTIPTLYIANGKGFCKAHKADAEALLRPQYAEPRSRNVQTAYALDQDHARYHRRDHIRGIRHAK